MELPSGRYSIQEDSDSLWDIVGKIDLYRMIVLCFDSNFIIIDGTVVVTSIVVWQRKVKTASRKIDYRDNESWVTKGSA